jgi:hypothetical protein
MFLRNVGSHKIYTAPHPRRRRSSSFGVFSVCLPVVFDEAGLLWAVVCVSMIVDIVWRIMAGAVACMGLNLILPYTTNKNTI